MSTITENVVEKTATCVVFHDDSSIRITSPKGSVIEVSHDKLKGTNPLWHKILTRGEQRFGTQVTLTYEQMRGIKSCAIDQVKTVQDRTAIVTEGHISAGNNGYGTTQEEQRIDRAQKAFRACDQKMSMLIYDIPSTLNDECPNPSGLLWKYGFRLNKSCWVLTERALAAREVQELLCHWKGFAVETHIIPYADEALNQIRRIARDKLTEEVARAASSLMKRLMDASERLEAVERELEQRIAEEKEVTWRDYERPYSLYKSAAYSSLLNARQAMDACISCARYFDETESIESLIQGLREAIRTEYESFKVHRACQKMKQA